VSSGSSRARLKWRARLSNPVGPWSSSSPDLGPLLFLAAPRRLGLEPRRGSSCECLLRLAAARACDVQALIKSTVSLRVRVIRVNKGEPILLSMMVSDDHGMTLTYRTESALRSIHARSQTRIDWNSSWRVHDRWFILSLRRRQLSPAF
jgi:hypothetical protein